jgi:hypothetical protein
MMKILVDFKAACCSRNTDERTMSKPERTTYSEHQAVSILIISQFRNLLFMRFPHVRGS